MHQCRSSSILLVLTAPRTTWRVLEGDKLGSPSRVLSSDPASASRNSPSADHRNRRTRRTSSIIRPAGRNETRGEADGYQGQKRSPGAQWTQSSSNSDIDRTTHRVPIRTLAVGQGYHRVARWGNRAESEGMNKSIPRSRPRKSPPLLGPTRIESNSPEARHPASGHSPIPSYFGAGILQVVCKPLQGVEFTNRIP